MNFPMFAFPAWLQVILGISQEEHRAIAVTGLLICLIVGFGFLVFPYIHTGQTHPSQIIGLLFLAMIVPFWLFGAMTIVVLILALLVWGFGYVIKILYNS